MADAPTEEEITRYIKAAVRAAYKLGRKPKDLSLKLAAEDAFNSARIMVNYKMKLQQDAELEASSRRINEAFRWYVQHDDVLHLAQALNVKWPQSLAMKVIETRIASTNYDAQRKKRRQ